MDLEAIYFASQVVAAIALVVSLVFVGLQMRQATKHQRSAASTSRVDRAADFFLDQARNPDLMAMSSRASMGLDDIGDIDALRFTRMIHATMTVLQERFLNNLDGVLEDSRWQQSLDDAVEPMRRPGYRAAVRLFCEQQHLDPRFRALVEKQLDTGRALGLPPRSINQRWRELVEEERALAAQSADSA